MRPVFMRVLILGCGYLGVRLGRLLVERGSQVLGMRREISGAEDLLREGIEPVVGDVTEAATLGRINGPFDWLINAVSSSKGGAETYRKVYLEGNVTLMDWMGARGLKSTRYLQVSSTSVYAQTDGGWVNEESPAEGASETSRILAQSENLVLEASRSWGVPAIVVRAAGIYGPGRGQLFLKHLQGRAAMALGGLQWINMIHVDDLAAACVAVLEKGRVGEVYNAVDNEPVQHKDFFGWLGSRLGLPVPPFADDETLSGRKRGATQKRVSNEKLRATTRMGFLYPTFREGYEREIRRLGLRPGLHPAPHPFSGPS